MNVYVIAAMVLITVTVGIVAHLFKKKAAEARANELDEERNAEMLRAIAQLKAEGREELPQQSSVTKERLTVPQMLALSSASFDVPIYGENTSHRHSQMPSGAECFSMRTVDSLLRKGYLISDNRSGYFLTEEGAAALRRGMGF
ncbi:hypothetical protein [Pseudomonas sp. Irchel s3b6]|uniref:hypothetical protein n=1 Tax=Pseudomonas sp. Irchel s3b6 TaxID=2009078 RepID=UPI000BA43B86|nr:hypothetical protein [Pseudomonas sp. Irchel s3b6]